MNEEATLLMLALDNLPPHLHAEHFGEQGNDQARPFHDVEVALRTAETTFHFDAEVKRIHRKESLLPLLNYARPNTLLICNTLSPFLADFCSKNGLNFIDEAGNARVTVPGLNLWIEGKRLSGSISTTSSHRGKPGVGFMKLLFILLAQENAKDLPFRELAKLANVSLGMVSKGFQYLASEKVVATQHNTRRILNKEALYHLWMEYYRTALRPKLGGIRLDVSANWQQIPLSNGDCWGGEVAADELTHYLQPYDLQLFTFEPLQKKIALIKAKPSQTGRLWLVPAFWGKELEITPKTKALLAVAELLASNDGRNIEVAGQINEHYLHLGRFYPR
ncbi:type IV toxin-antitoxin system AbiEi family antitoxin [Bowmanella denitrificans]|uniref:type IV toxin-antitoxin system AbiEi family antitoxin n=1 Tax=Bowmanella denitrificans TaxID=366582 RepID=UPI000C9B94DA|nr:type IV toxin-antitoxin system AbiEi family antitoxin [Bowmanella denitrificans]